MGGKESMPPISNQEYIQIIPRIIYYLRNKNKPRIFKHKHRLFAAGGYDTKIDLISNSLEYLGCLKGHQGMIRCLIPMQQGSQLASSSWDTTVKIWDMDTKSIISTLSDHKSIISALCEANVGVLVGGSTDGKVIIWEKAVVEGYRERFTLSGHISEIRGIVYYKESELIIGEEIGYIRIWNLMEEKCIKRILIPKFTKDDTLYQIKLFRGRKINFLICSMKKSLVIWKILGNNTICEGIIKQFMFTQTGWPVELLANNILLRGEGEGKLELVEIEKGSSIHQGIRVHSNILREILCVAKNIIIIASYDGDVKVIDPISGKCYFIFTNSLQVYAITKFY